MFNRKGFPELYLEKSEIIDFDHPDIIKLCEKIRRKSPDTTAIIKNSFELVRDKIPHASDCEKRIITCHASEVLLEKVGSCYAKSHLLAALLRGNGIPAGFCYQKIVFDEPDSNDLILHGLNAVWTDPGKDPIRLDASGIKTAPFVHFDPNNDNLIYRIRKKLGEENIDKIFSRPDRNVVEKLRAYTNIKELLSDLPRDLEVKE